MWLGNDLKLPQTRLTIVSYIILGMIALLLVGFWKLQVIDSDRYTQLAERNRVRTIPLIAPRGRMLDREGRVLVDNYPSFSVLLLRDDAQQVERSLPQVAEGLGIPLEDLHKQLDESRGLPKFQPILIKPEASPADIAFIESHRADLQVLEMVMVHRRRYLPNGFMAHAAGYVGEVSPELLENSNGRYRPGDFEGKSGLERQYNDVLVGTDGLRRVLVNSIGKEVGRLDQKEAIPGKAIQLTIDYDLQVVAEQALTGRKGAVVALDPRTGDVLAMVSHPAPDSNLFAVRIPREDWKRLNEDPDRPLRRCAVARISVSGGQGAIVATPLRLARTIGGIAMGGIFRQPHLLLDAKKVGEERFSISEQTTEKVTQAMFGVVNEGGTAAGVRLQGIELCGKTGSAQVIGAEGLKRAGRQTRFKDNAWFVGYAPRRKPEIVVAVLVQEGEHGASAAAPVARDVIKAYYDKKSRRNQQQLTVEYKRYQVNPDAALAGFQALRKPVSRPLEANSAQTAH